MSIAESVQVEIAIKKSIELASKTNFKTIKRYSNLHTTDQPTHAMTFINGSLNYALPSSLISSPVTSMMEQMSTKLSARLI